MTKIKKHNEARVEDEDSGAGAVVLLAIGAGVGAWLWLRSRKPQPVAFALLPRESQVQGQRVSQGMILPRGDFMGPRRQGTDRSEFGFAW